LASLVPPPPSPPPPLHLPPLAIGALGERGLQIWQNFVLSLWSNATTAAQAGGGGMAWSDTRYYLML
jgi:hypothetical protein